MRGKLACLVAVAAIQLLSAGCIVRTAAGTKLEIIAKNGGVIRIGMKSSAWEVREDTFEVFAYGAHPREHETYAFIAIEAYPIFQPRMLRLTGPSDAAENATFRIQMLLSPILLDEARTAADGANMIMFVGTAQLTATHWFGQRRIRLNNVMMQRAGRPEQVLQVSGEVVAKSNSQQEFSRLASCWAKWQD